MSSSDWLFQIMIYRCVIMFIFFLQRKKTNQKNAAQEEEGFESSNKLMIQNILSPFRIPLTCRLSPTSRTRELDSVKSFSRRLNYSRDLFEIVWFIGEADLSRGESLLKLRQRQFYKLFANIPTVGEGDS